MPDTDTLHPISRRVVIGGLIQTMMGIASGYQPAAGPAGANPLVYVADRDSGRVTVIDGVTMQIVRTLNTGGTPYAPVLSPDGLKAYVSSYFDSQLYVVNTQTGAILADIPVGGGAGQLAINPAGTRVYVPSHRGPDVYVIDAINNTFITAIPTGSGAHSVAVSPDGTRAICPNYDGGTISFIDATTNQVIVNRGPYDHATHAAIRPQGDFAYVSVASENRIAIFEMSASTEIGSIPDSNRPGMLKMHPDGTRAFVVDINANAVAVIDTSTHAFINSLPLDPAAGVPQFLALTADGGTAYVTSWIDVNTPGFVQRVNLTTGQLAKTTVGLVPYGITVFPGPPVPPPFPVSLRFTPESVRGGKRAMGEVSLNRAADIGGLLVSLSSSNRKIATVPRSVIVPKGATSVTFVVRTKKVKRTRVVTVSASATGRTVTGELTVTRKR